MMLWCSKLSPVISTRDTGFISGDGLGTKAVILEQTAANQNNTRMERTLINQGFNPLQQPSNKYSMFPQKEHTLAKLVVLKLRTKLLNNLE
jgi:hypothetical protein